MTSTHNNLFWLLLGLFIFLGSASGCKESTYYSNDFELEEGVWTYNQPFINEFEVRDTASTYNLILDIRHDREYSFQNIYMQISTHFPGDTAVTDLLTVDMADRAGKWNGNCSGTTCDLRVYLQQKISFRELGTHRVVFEQFTRNEQLEGIEKMSFKIIPN